MSTHPQHLYEFGAYRLDTAERLLLRNGEPVPLTPKAFETLVALVERSGHLVEKEELMKVVWSDAFVEESNLTNNVYALRKMLGQSENGKSYIETIPKRGYRFTAPVKELPPETLVVEKRTVTRVVTEEHTDGDDAPPQTLISAGEAIQRAPAHGTRMRLRLWLVIASVAVAVGLVAFLIYRGFTSKPATRIESIAVLPFANASGDAQLDYVSDGLSESLIDRLSQISGLKVIARSSSFKYKGQQADPREVAKALGVETIVVGRVVQRGQDLEVRAELVDAREGTQIWGEHYSRRAEDLQSVQEEIARRISEKLRLRLSGEQEQRLTRRATGNSQAYQFYLNGLFHLRIADAKRALDYFNQAVAMDPDFAFAWAGLARTHLMFAGSSLLDPKEANAKAKAAAERALKLDDTLADAHVAMAILKQHEWDWAGADREFRRAIELNPSEVLAHDRYTDYLSCMGRHGEALAENKRAQELDPLQIRLRRREAWTLHLARRSREALQLMQQLIKLEPPTVGTHDSLAWIYEGNGMYEEAVAERQKAINISGETTGGLCYLGGALAGAGRKAEAQAILDKLKTTKEYVSPEELAGLYAMLGDKESAFAQLERAYAARDLQLQVLKIDLRLDSLRSDPRFTDLVRRVGLPQ
ncbi:MAG TPA: winged helix-turn-helix domain-containing protein [Pyrinomonadaceae bacterium]|nr:winged helix-turn-helix domain-containing protein [Pyrinomonadaceae bacterium]